MYNLAMLQINSSQFRQYLKATLELVKAGKSIIITHHGKPVAKVTPIREEEEDDVNTA